MRTLKTLPLYALLLACCAANAQQYTLKESSTDLQGPKHELLSCPNGDYITITYPFEDDKNPVIVSRFDHSLTQKYANKLDDLSKQHYHASMHTDSHLALFCSNKDGEISRYDVDPKTGALSGAPAALFTLEAKEEDAKFASGNAPGKAWHYFVASENKRKEKGMIIQGVILDQQYGKVAAFSYTTPEDRDDFNHADYIQSDDGGMYIIYSVSVKTNKEDYTPFAYKVVMVDTKGAARAFPLAGLPAGKLSDISWTIEGTRLSFTGLISHSKKKGFTTILTGSLDFQKKTGGFHQTELSTLLAQAPDYLKDIKENGIPAGVALLRTLTLSDGSRVLLLEENGDRLYQSHYAPISTSNPAYSSARPGSATSNLNMGMTASYSVPIHIRGNAYLLKTDKNNVPQWIDVISKKQEEPDLVLAIGTASTTDNKDNVHIFFFDSRKNADPTAKSPNQISGRDYKSKKNGLACVTVTSTGAMTKRFIDQEDPEYRLMLEKSEGEVNNELCFMAIKTKTAFSAEHLLNHANYRIGTIAVN